MEGSFSFIVKLPIIYFVDSNNPFTTNQVLIPIKDEIIRSPNVRAIFERWNGHGGSTSSLSREVCPPPTVGKKWRRERTSWRLLRYGF